MSTSARTPPGDDPNPKRPNPPEPGHSSSPTKVNLPLNDPPLGSGSFTDADAPANSAGKTATTSTTPIRKQQPENPPATPDGVPESGLPPDATPRRRGASSLESWLPPGWVVEDRVRTSGVTAGTVDKYYYHTESGRRFRSKKEVLYFLETGIKRKRKRENSGADIDASQMRTPGSSSTKQKKSGTRVKTSTLNFDYMNAPENIQWVLTDPSTNSWNPFIGKDEVPESVRQDWASAFTQVTTSNGGYPLF